MEIDIMSKYDITLAEFSCIALPHKKGILDSVQDLIDNPDKSMDVWTEYEINNEISFDVNSREIDGVVKVDVYPVFDGETDPTTWINLL
jgi:hypothetical protein